MAGIEFDRQAFATSNPPQTRPLIQLLGPAVLVLALMLIAFVGYKAFLVNTQNNEVASWVRGSAFQTFSFVICSAE